MVDANRPEDHRTEDFFRDQRAFHGSDPILPLSVGAYNGAEYDYAGIESASKSREGVAAY